MINFSWGTPIWVLAEQQQMLTASFYSVGSEAVHFVDEGVGKMKRMADSLGLLRATSQDFDFFLPDETPLRWHYTKRDDRYDRIGDILLIARFPKVFNLPHRKPLIGMHGWDNALTDLQASGGIPSYRSPARPPDHRKDRRRFRNAERYSSLT